MNKISLLCSSLRVIKFYYLNEWDKLKVENVFVSALRHLLYPSNWFCCIKVVPVRICLPIHINFLLIVFGLVSSNVKSYKFSYRVKEAVHKKFLPPSPRDGPQLFDRPALNICVSHPTHTPELLISCTQMNTDDLSVFSVLNECKQCSFANLTCRQSHRGHYSSSKRVDLSRKTCEWRNRL